MLFVVLFVKQFRPSLWYHETGGDTSKIDENTGFSYEFCAGLCDKEGLEPKEVAIEEVLEETGYAVPSVNYITSSFTGLGFSYSIRTIWSDCCWVIHLFFFSEVWLYWCKISSNLLKSVKF
ncbi:MAG: NUDIX domain-containing protein [Campylobacter sp.]|uniref:NUDIX domain-containing protein n=1 Tax=Campylobacter sp. TaxID=205 RepID=UPI002A81C175|nr:NUDIX domain-containing protein [Campylobacter sp.]MCI7587985.1 NUDIX domain-containing protein [Campylobacter sp.]MDY5114866.1 NUDIX domain-containing protein [Campylobacter sp.]